MMRSSFLLVLALGLAQSSRAAETTAPLAVPALSLPTPVVRTLPNGLRVAVFVVPRAPIVQLQLRVPGGSALEDTAASGVAMLTAQMLRRGTTSRAPEQFDAELDALGGTLVANVTRDDAQIGAGFLAADLDPGLEILSDAVINPRFGDDELERMRRSLARQAIQQRLDLRAISDDVAWGAVYPAHAYARSPLGSLRGLAQARRESLRSFHRDHWRPDHSVLAIAGDVDTEQAFRSAEEWFGRWSGKAAAAPRSPAPQGAAAAIRRLDVPSARRAEIRLLWAAPGAASPDAAAWRLAAQAMNAAGTLPAGSRATQVTLREAGLLVVSAGAAPESVASVVRGIREAVRAFAATTPGAPSLGVARGRLQDEFAFPLEALGALIGQWLSLDAAGFGADALGATWMRLGEVPSAAPALAALAAEPIVLAAGSGAAFTEAVAALGEARPLELESVGSLLPPTLPTPPTAEERRRGRAVVRAALLAHGGAARIARVRDVTQEGRTFMFVEGSEISGTLRQVRRTPYQLLVSTRFPEFQATQGLNGDEAWVSAHGDSEVVESDEQTRGTLRALYESDLVNLLRSAADSSTVVSRRGSERIADRPADLVDFTLPSGVRARLAVDAATHRVVAVDTDFGPDGIWHQRRSFSDFRPVGGLVLPFFEERKVDGTRLTTWRLERVLVDSGVDASVFRRPESRMGTFSREKP